jgi:transposase
MLQPLRRRTWAPRGQTPLLRAWDRRDRLSVITALSLPPRNLRVGMYFEIFDHNIRTPQVVEFLKRLHRQLRRDIIVVCDRWKVHRSAVRQLCEQGCDWLTVEWLPGYAPDLDPVEHVWNHAKYTDLPNFTPDDVQHLHRAVRRSLENQTRDPWLKNSFFRSAQLHV